MNTTNVTVGSTKDTSRLQRARFRPGMLLESEDLELLNTYTRDLSRLLFGSLFGCGVICGLVVKADPHCDNLKITVGAGVALGCSGDPIQVPKDVVFPLDESYVPEVNEKLWVVLCGTSKCCAPRTAICSSDDDETTSECSRERDGFEIKVLTERPVCVCGCPEPPEVQYSPTNINKNPNYMGRGGKSLGATAVATRMDCECADPESECYKDHYDGICGCHCDDCVDCDCKCILLARIDRVDTDSWRVDHRVRRFIRPVLIRDPQVYLEQHPQTYSTVNIGQSAIVINQAAYDAAEKVMVERAEKVAKQAAGKLAEQEVNDLGKRAVDEVVRQILAEAARQGAEEAIKKQAEEQAAAEAEIAAEQEAAEQEYEGEQQDISQQKSKQIKSTKSNKGGLPPRS